MAKSQFVSVNVAMATSGNEYSLAIPPEALDVHIKLADATNTVKVYTVSVGNGGTPANYWTIDAGQVLELRTKLGGNTLYLMSTVSSLIAQACYVTDI